MPCKRPKDMTKEELYALAEKNGQGHLWDEQKEGWFDVARKAGDDLIDLPFKAKPWKPAVGDLARLLVDVEHTTLQGYRIKSSAGTVAKIERVYPTGGAGMIEYRDDPANAKRALVFRYDVRLTNLERVA